MKKIIIFGTSFVNTFLSIKYKNFTIVKYKGAMIKGLIDKNDNYKSMINILDKNLYNYGLFMFGDPDCIFYYYKKKYVDNCDENNIEKVFYKNVEKYVKLVSELKNIDNKYILGVSPPTVIDDEDYRKALTIYGTLTEDQANKITKKDLEYNFRFNRFVKFNKILEESCKKYNINFCNIFNKLLDNNQKIDKLFRLKFNPYNVHYNLEAVLIVYLNSCLSFLADKNILFAYKDIINKIKLESENYYKQLFKINSLDNNFNDYKLDIKKIENFAKRINKKLQSK